MKKRNPPAGRAGKIIYWIATIWLSLGMLSTGALQLFRLEGDGPGSPDSMTNLGYPAYFVMLLGIAKVLGVIVLLIPKFPLLKEWAYAGYFFMMSGAVYTHIAAGNSISEIFPSLLLLILTLVSWYFRPSDRKMISVNQFKNSIA